MMHDYGAMWRRVIDDPEYAWSWHCQIAVPIMDGGVEHRTANEYAARVMRSLFGVDIHQNSSWKATFPFERVVYEVYEKVGGLMTPTETAFADTEEADEAHREVYQERLDKGEIACVRVVRSGAVIAQLVAWGPAKKTADKSAATTISEPQSE